MNATRPQVVVRGEAMLLVDPEIAELAVTVTGRARDRQSAMERCRARQDDVTAVVTAAGDAVETSETAGVSVYLECGRRADGDPVATLGTRVSSAGWSPGDLVVALGRLDDVTVTGPWWRLRPEAPRSGARLAAVQDAVHRARQYAAAFGSELTALVEVSDAGMSGRRTSESRGRQGRWEGSGQRPQPRPHAGPQEVHGSVEVRFTMSGTRPGGLPSDEISRGWRTSTRRASRTGAAAAASGGGAARPWGRRRRGWPRAGRPRRRGPVPGAGGGGGGDSGSALGGLAGLGQGEQADNSRTRAGLRRSRRREHVGRLRGGRRHRLDPDLLGRVLGDRYVPTDTVFFEGQVQTSCGAATSGSGPFYCPGDSARLHRPQLLRPAADTVRRARAGCSSTPT